MCGKCIEGCFLAGWRDGTYSFDLMQETPDFMGKDVMAAHSLVEIVASPGSNIESLHNHDFNFSPMMAWAAWVYSQNTSFANAELTDYQFHLENQRAKRYAEHSDWAELTLLFPEIAAFLDTLTLDQVGELPNEKLLNEIETCLLFIHGDGFYKYELIASMFDNEGVFPAISLSDTAKPSVFITHALEIFLLTEHLLRYRPTSWLLRVTLTVDLTCDFDSFHMAWRRYVANRIFGKITNDEQLAFGSTLPLNTIRAICQRNANDKPLLRQMLAIVKKCKGDEQIIPEQLVEHIKALLLK